MTDKPIIFSAPMVWALLDGRKTQTRRILKPQPPEQPAANCHPAHKPRHSAPYLDAYCGEPRTPQNPRGQGHDWHWWQVDDRPGPVACRVPYAPGDRLYVREAHYLTDTGDYEIAICAGDADAVREHFDLINGLAVQHGLPETWKAPHLKLRPSIHMPRWASRLTLTVTEVRVQRLQEITGRDIISEGVRCEGCHNVGTGNYSACRDGGCFAGRNDFRDLWNSLHGPDAWDANPWCVAISFTVQKGNIDAL
jgi:hypothetical protein